jgi:hypothetical protein
MAVLPPNAGQVLHGERRKKDAVESTLPHFTGVTPGQRSLGSGSVATLDTDVPPNKRSVLRQGRFPSCDG